MPIEKVRGRQIFDSRGQPTLEIDVITDIGLFRSSVSYSPPIDSNEDDDSNTKNLELDIFKAIENVNNIGRELVRSRLDVCQQREIDSLLKRMSDETNFGSEILGVSMACCKAGAVQKGIPLYRYINLLSDTPETVIPVPLFTMIIGGKLSGNSLAFQEFSIMPTGAKSFHEAMQIGNDVFRGVEKLIAESEELKLPLTVGEDGSFSPDFDEDREALLTIVDAIKIAGTEGKVKLAINMSASSFCKEGQYDLEFKTEETDPDDYLEAEALRDQYLELLTEFPQVVSVEDPFDQDDWDGWPLLADQAIQIAASDLTAMDVERVEDAVERGLANCLVVRLSQARTVSEAIDCFKIARSNGWSTIVCAGSTETEDNFIADFAVGLSAGQFKVGGPCRGERTAKYNQILRIEEELGRDAKYAGEMFRKPLDLGEIIVNQGAEGKLRRRKKRKTKKSMRSQ